jgi:hypothetical protein
MRSTATASRTREFFLCSSVLEFELARRFESARRSSLEIRFRVSCRSAAESGARITAFGMLAAERDFAR